MDTVARAVTYISALVSLAALVQTVRKLVKEAPVSRLAPLVSIGATLVTTALYVLITGSPVNWWGAIVLFLLGIVIGYGEGQLTRLYYRGETLIVKRSVGYLIVWGAAYLVTLALDQLGNAALHAVGVWILAFGVGTAISSNLVLLARQITQRPSLTATPAVPGGQPVSTAPPLYLPGLNQVPPGAQPLRSAGQPPVVYPPSPSYVRRRSDSTCLILTIVGILGVLCAALAVIVLILSGTQG
jgi:hypothetical protein